jgi:hypothetical protein
MYLEICSLKKACVPIYYNISCNISFQLLVSKITWPCSNQTWTVPAVRKSVSVSLFSSYIPQQCNDCHHYWCYSNYLNLVMNEFMNMPGIFFYNANFLSVVIKIWSILQHLLYQSGLSIKCKLHNLHKRDI